MRLRKKAWAVGEIETNPLIINLDFEHDDCAFFDNKNPVMLELGCGKGRFIRETARLKEDVNFIAVERSHKIIAVAAKNARLDGLTNVRFLNIDVQRVGALFNKNEIAQIYINFCDPWSKNKYIKKRLTHRNFLEMYKDMLSENGLLVFKTDNVHLFDFTLRELEMSGWALQKMTRDLYAESQEFVNGNVMTEYETKFNALGMPIHMLEAVPAC